MNRQRILKIAGILAVSLLMAGCTQDEWTDGNAAAAPFSITVTDDGYASGNPETRATENGYQTVFTAGDNIGIFAVKDGEIVSEINNLRFTAEADGNAGGIVWKNSNGVKLPTGATYYAYYPYRQSLTGNLVATTATDAGAFFANIIHLWTPAPGQDTPEKYTAQDLMISKGSLTGNTLTFSMTHQMALVVIDLPLTRYVFTNSSPTVPDYIIDVPGTTFKDFYPCRMSDGTYRYLVNPATNSNLSGSYTKAAATTGTWTISASSLAPGNYTTVKVDGGARVISHNLQVGDFYMYDGSLLAGTSTPTAGQKKACIGIVYWIGDATQQDKTLKSDHSNCTHGLVVALKDAANERIIAWQNKPHVSVQDWLNNNQSGKFLSVVSGTHISDPLNNIQGYNNTKAIEMFNAANSTNNVLTVQAAVEYRSKVRAPRNSSDWYLPSAKELALLCGVKAEGNIWVGSSTGTTMRNFLNEGPLKNLGTYAAPFQLALYWSSTEYDKGYGFDDSFYNGLIGAQEKQKGELIRCILAF